MRRASLTGLLLGLTPLAAARAEGPAWALYVRGGAAAHLSEARVQVGVGGGVGLRHTWGSGLLVQGDVGPLFGAGGLLQVRAGVGLERALGAWTPALLCTGTALVGAQLSFATAAHPVPVRLPGLSLGLSLAPARLRARGVTVSLMEVTAGLGSDLPGRGVGLGLTLLEVGSDF